MSQSSAKYTQSMKLYREFAILALGAISIFVLLALVSFSPSDPLWLNAFQSEQISNIVGSAGAFIAGMLLSCLGYVAFGVPIVLSLYLILVTRSRARPYDGAEFLLSLGGCFGTMLALCVLADIHIDTSLAFPYGPGGVLGRLISDLTVPIVNIVGVTLIFVTLMLIFVQAMIGFTWVSVAKQVFKGTILVGRVSLQTMNTAFNLSRKLIRGTRDSTSQTTSEILDEAPRKIEILTPENHSKAATKYENRLATIKKRKEKKEAMGVPVTAGANHVTNYARKVNGKTQSKQAQPESLVGAISSQSVEIEKPLEFQLPSLELLIDSTNAHRPSEGDLRALQTMARKLTTNLNDFGVSVEVVSIVPGPVVTRFELELARGLKVSKIISLANDLARELAVVSVRVVPVIPGKSVVGIEVPNSKRAVVSLKEILSSDAFQSAEATLTLALGKGVAGEPVVANIERMPHLLVAGTTGSGKSVGINTMLLSLLYRLTPNDVRLILVDPKMLELSVYDGIPHLLTPVVTDMEKAAKVLNWCVMEMERRYALMASLEVRNLDGYNQRIDRAAERGQKLYDDSVSLDAPDETQEHKRLPLIVVVIDEFADMFMIVGKKVETLIARIAQKARAAGIHLVLATQRPSVDVITGLIKANIPCRMSYQVSSQVDSRTILDQVGAEHLLGHGDMLYLAPGTSVPERVHGAFVTDEEVLSVVAEWKRRGDPEYLEDMFPSISSSAFNGDFGLTDDSSDDELYRDAVEFVIDSRKASISSVQRKLRIGYNRAARLVETMESSGIVSVADHNGTRKVLIERSAD